jgi:hypothetical protein
MGKHLSTGTKRTREYSSHTPSLFSFFYKPNHRAALAGHVGAVNACIRLGAIVDGGYDVDHPSSTPAHLVFAHIHTHSLFIFIHTQLYIISRTKYEHPFKHRLRAWGMRQ